MPFPVKTPGPILSKQTSKSFDSKMGLIIANYIAVIMRHFLTLKLMCVQIKRETAYLLAKSLGYGIGKTKEKINVRDEIKYYEKHAMTIPLVGPGNDVDLSLTTVICSGGSREGCRRRAPPPQRVQILSF